MNLSINPAAILIDLDGTLADSLCVMQTVYQKFLHAHGLEATEAEFDALNGPPLKEVVHRLKKTHALPEKEELLLEQYQQCLFQAYQTVRPRIGAKHFLQQVKQNACQVGVITSNSNYLTKLWLKSVGIETQIDFIVSGEEVKQGKPHPEPYLLGIKRSGCKAANIIAIEDSFQGATSALQSGLNTFIFISDCQPVKCPAGVHLIHSFAQLSDQLW